MRQHNRRNLLYFHSFEFNVSSSPPNMYFPAFLTTPALKSPAGRNICPAHDHLCERSSSDAFPILDARGLNISGKSGVSISCNVCSGLTYKLPAPPTTINLLLVPDKRSHSFFNDVLCCVRLSGFHVQKRLLLYQNYLNPISKIKKIF